MSRRSPLDRLVALVLVHALAATSVWSGMPSVRAQGPSPSLRPLLALAVPPLDALAGGAPGDSDHGDDRDDRRDRDDRDRGRGDDDDRDSHSGGGSHSGRGLHPVVECVSREGWFHWTARFGYRNDDSGAVEVPVGSRNFLAPGPARQGQPTRFEPGRSPLSAAFAVPFSGIIPVAWALRGPDGKTQVAVASVFSERCSAPPPPPPPAPACQTVFYGPQRFERNGCGTDGYRARIDVPASVAGPYLLRVRNGAASGAHRVSSAWIKIDGEAVFGPSDFNPNVGTRERVAPLSSGERARLDVLLSGKPGSYLTVEACGGGGDATPPAVSLVHPAPGSAIADPRPTFRIAYDDPAGAGQVAGSGVDPSTLSVFVDGEDRTALFVRQSNEATAEWPEELAFATGDHQVVVAISDRAGNRREYETSFGVDLEPPTLTRLEPAEFVADAQPLVRLSFADAQGLDAESLLVEIDGEDRTSWFEAVGGEASGRPPAPLAPGAHVLTAAIRDLAGNLATAQGAFVVDLAAPTLEIGQPRDGARLGTDLVELIVRFGDDQAVDPGSFAATLDGAPISLSIGPDGAMGFAGPLADGAHRFEVRVRDRAGRETVASAAFSVDRTRPSLEVFEPAPGLVTRDATPEVVVRYSDAEGLDLATFAAAIGGVGRTSAFAVGEDEARAQLDESTRLPEGGVDIDVEIADLAGNRATARASITVDTVAPRVTLISPIQDRPSGAALPEIHLGFEDPAPGTGVETAAVRVRIDGIDATAAFVIGSTGAIGTPPSALAEGPHSVEVSLADRAGNQATTSFDFALDLSAPVVEASAPLAPFVATNDPEVVFQLADAGAGVDPESVVVLLASPSLPERDVTADFAVDCADAACSVRGVVASGLADGSHRFTVRAADQAGNLAEAGLVFEVDTVAPTLAVEAPALDAFLATGRPELRLRYADERSGVDVARIELRVDGIDRSALLTPGVDRATGWLAPEAEPLADGTHAFEVVVHDRAGNASEMLSQSFVVDTVAPTIASVAPPAGSWLATRTPELRFTWSDSGSGVDVGWTRLAIDGLDQAGLAPQADGIAFTPPGLPDGAHEARAEIRDLAGNVAHAAVAFRVDTVAPTVPDLQAGDDGWYDEVDADGRGPVSGRVSDLDPNVALECLVGGAPSPACSCSAVGADGTFSCSVPLAEGENEVEIRARDAAGNETRTERTLRLDTVAPAVAIRAPVAETVTAAESVDVEVEVTDASPVTVSVEGIEAVAEGCDGASPARCTLRAAGVPLGAGPFATLVATATDAAGHVATGSVRLRVDRAAPQVTIVEPTAGAFARGSAIDVSGTVADATAVLVDVNGIPATVGGGGTFTGATHAWTFQATVPIVDGAASIAVTAHDEAGLSGTAERTLTIDSAPPALAITAPAPGLVTRASSLEIAGTVADATAVSVTVDGTPVSVVGGAFAFAAALDGAEGPRTFVVQATDAAGNVSSASVAIVVDRAAPALAIATPDEGATVLALPLPVAGTVSDASGVVVLVDGVAATVDGTAWSASVSLGEGRQTFEVVAADAAGNEARVARNVLVDLAAPELAVSAPEPGLLTRDEQIGVVGTVHDASVVAVTVNGIAATVSGGEGTCASPCTFTASVDLPEGDSTLLVVATDAAGRVAELALPVTRDSTPPVIALTAPDTISAGRPGQAVASLADGVALESGRLQARISAECSLGAVDGTSSSLVLALVVPECARAGDTVTVTLDAADRAGNAATLSRVVRVVADGAIAGQALDATTGLPLSSVQVRVDGAVATAAAVTDASGRYALPATDQRVVLRLAKDGYTSVERSVEVASGQGTVAVDAFLTPLAPPVAVDAAGGAVHVHVPRASSSNGVATCTGDDCAPSPVRLTLPPGAYTVTGLSPQALPDLLPLGWSALVAFDLGSSDPVPPSTLGVEGLEGAVHLVRYSTERHAWVLEQAAVGASATLPGGGSFALVVADAVEPPLAVPAAGEALEGLPMVALPAAAASEGAVTPPVIPPTGGTALGAIRLTGVEGVPSGTVVQASVVESYELATGEQASSEPRTFDIVVSRQRALQGLGGPEAAGGACPAADGTLALCAEFPITPSRSYAPTELTEGRVHLDILAGREGVRGAVGGGSQAVTLTAGEIAVAVAQGALAEDLALAVEQHALSTYLPSDAGLVPLAELSFDASGATLGSAAQVTVAAAIAAGDSAVLARVERADGIPYLVVVAAFDVEAERVVSRTVPGLPGLREGGRYVVYRIAGPVAFVTGTTSAAGAPVQARVVADALPFHAFTRADGHYALAVIPGTRVLTATVPGTSLLGTASVQVPTETAVPIALQGVVTTATVAPEDGAVAIAPTASVTIEAQAPIAPVSVTADAIRLVDEGTETPVALRFVLSTSGRTLSVIPLQALSFATRYRLEAPGLRDTFGGLVQVPVTRFTTKADTPPEYDLAAIRFGYPGEDGLVQVTAPTGTLPPGTQILIINAGNGAVATFTAENDGSLGTIFPADLPATISDTLYVTVTDPLGNVTTFTRSEYVAEDGTTGIGPGGGTVRGEGGVELRIPEGALKKGATFKLRLVDPSELPTLFPNAQHETLATSLGAHHGSVLRLEASEGTRLEKEADLVFPLPDFTAVPESERPAKPEDAFYYIHRRVERCADGSATCAPENRIVVFEVIDEARAEGEGASARVVTASPPFAGVIGVMSGALLLYSMSWSYDLSLLGRPRPGLIRGKVLRTEWGSDGAAFKAVPDAHVTGTDAGGVALSSKDGGAFATSQGDGTYALWDYAFTGGTTRIDAALGAESASATAFEVSEGPGIGVYNKVAHANITFPAVEPPPVPPQVEIQVVQESTGSLISGVVVSGTTLQIGFRSNTPETEYTIYGARVAGQELAVRQAQQGDRPGWTHVVAEPFTPTNPGTYTVEAAAAPGVGSPVNTSTTFRVIAEGGSVETDPLSPPKVITARLYPKPNATGVPVTAFLNVAFTEPVRGIPGNVRLLAGELEIPIRISGVTPDGQVIEAISGDHEILTSLTIQPLAGLRYSTAYRLLLASGITDLDLEPKPLEPFELPFTTFGPAGVGGTTDDRNGSAGIVVLGDRAYLTRTNALVNGNIVVFDITDPVEPVEVAVSEIFAPRPYDIVGEQADTGEKLIAVATGSTNRSKPASVLLFEASTSEVPQFVGAASLTSSAADGFTSRIAIHGGFVYSATVRKGIQGVEIQRAKNTWSGLDSQPTPDLARQNAKTKLNTDGEGFGQDAVVINLPIPLKSNATPYYLNDIKAADVAGQTLVAVAGEPGLILAQPFISGITYQGRPEREGTRLDWGYALALGRLQDRDVAVVVGRGTVAGAATTLLITLDVSNPQAPLVLGAVSLSAVLGALVPVDILLKDSTALLGVQNSTGDQGFVLLVNLADLATPEVSGRLEDVAGRLALDENGLLYGSARLSTGGFSVNGGVKTATLGPLPAILRVRPTLARRVGDSIPAMEETLNDIRMTLKVFPADYPVQEASLQFFANGAPLTAATMVPVVNGSAVYTISRGFRKAADNAISAVMAFFAEGQEVTSAPRRIDIGALQLTVDSNNDTLVDDKDDEDVQSDPSKDDPQKALRFGFWDSPLNARGELSEGEDALSDYATVRIRLKTDLALDERVGVYLPGGDWEMHRKVARSDFPALVPAPPSDCLSERKLHLCNAAAAKLQVSINAVKSGDLVPSPVSQSGLIEVPRELLRRGDNHFLFRCKGRQDGLPACPGQTIQVVQITPSSFEKLDERGVEIRPIKHWLSVANVRPSTGFRPKAQVELLSDWAPVPDTTKEITVLVHGFNVPAELAEDSFFPTYFKRLYWTGHPVLSRQGSGASGYAHTVGFSWPGDQFVGRSPSAVLFFPEDEFHALQAGVPLAGFLKGLKQATGRRVNVIAHSLGNMVVHSALMQPGMDGVIDLYLMNQAAVPAEAFDANYSYSNIEKNAMWPHAAAYGYSEDPGARDVVWSNEWTDMVMGQPYKRGGLAPEQGPEGSPPIYIYVPDYADFDVWQDQVGSDQDPSYLLPRPKYEIRWSQQRPEGPELLPVDPTDRPRRGPWKGLFAWSRTRTRIVNSFNPGDQAIRIDKGFGQTGVSIPLSPFVLTNPFTGGVFTIGLPMNPRVYAWHDSQLLQKPRVGFIANYAKPTVRLDDRKTQEWARLNVDVEAEESIWADGGNHSNITRQWAELAFWFPALSGAAGSKALGLVGIQDEDFSRYGGDDSGFDPLALVEVPSHSYMVGKPFSEVWGAHVRFKDLLKAPQP